jgi:hypothetical protein
MDIRQRVDAPLDSLLKALRCVGLRQVYYRSHIRQQVFGSILSLASENTNLRLAWLALASITSSR